MPYLGVQKIRIQLQERDGLPVGRKLIRRYMDEMGIYAVYPKPNLSKPNKQHRIYPYLLRNLDINHANQVWAIDITYIKMGRGHMYLTAIIDWYSRYIIGWELSDTLDTAPVLAAVKDAIRQYGKPKIINRTKAVNLVAMIIQATSKPQEYGRVWTGRPAGLIT